MKKCLIILAAVMFPAALSAQSALHQLESMAGMSIQDVNVPKPSDPVRVDDDEDEDSQSEQSTHLKDYTPAQETTATQTPQPKQKTWQEIERERAEQAEEASRRERLERDKQKAEKWKSHEEQTRQEHRRYQTFLDSSPKVKSTPNFSSINERNILFDSPQSLEDLSKIYGKFYVWGQQDSMYRADMIRYSEYVHPSAKFLGHRLENGRVEWRMYQENLFTNMYHEQSFGGNLRSDDIKDVVLAVEGRVVLVYLKDGRTLVLKPSGETICSGTNILFPCMAEDGGVFIECDGRLFYSDAPAFSNPILWGNHLDYYSNCVVVTSQYSTGETYYNLSTYGGREYDWDLQAWIPVMGYYGERHTAYSYIGAFQNEGAYFVIQPQGKKYYYIVSDMGGGLFRSQKKYKSIEDAHAAWPKERAYIYNLRMNKPSAAAQNK